MSKPTDTPVADLAPWDERVSQVEMSSKAAALLGSSRAEEGVSGAQPDQESLKDDNKTPVPSRPSTPAAEPEATVIPAPAPIDKGKAVRSPGRDNKKTGGKKKVTLIPESDVSSAEGPASSGTGLYGREIATPLSAVSDRMINPFAGRVEDEQLSGTSLQRTVDELVELVANQDGLIKLLETKIQALTASVNDTNVSNQAVRATVTQLNTRMEEFDAKSLSVVDRAAEILDRVAPDEKPLVQSLKAEKAAAIESQEKGEKRRVKVAVAPKQKQSKKISFSSI